jgi:hypothetical protein
MRSTSGNIYIRREVQDDADGPHIRLIGILHSLNDLRTHVEGRSLIFALGRQLSFLANLAQPEIYQFNREISSNEYVLELETELDNNYSRCIILKLCMARTAFKVSLSKNKISSYVKNFPCSYTY